MKKKTTASLALSLQQKTLLPPHPPNPSLTESLIAAFSSALVMKSSAGGTYTARSRR